MRFLSIQLVALGHLREQSGPSFCRLDNRLHPMAPFLFILVFCFYTLKFILSFLFNHYLVWTIVTQQGQLLIKICTLTSLLPCSSVTSAFTQKIYYNPLNNCPHLTLLPKGTTVLSNFQGLFILFVICPTFHTQEICFTLPLDHCTCHYYILFLDCDLLAT